MPTDFLFCQIYVAIPIFSVILYIIICIKYDQLVSLLCCKFQMFDRFGYSPEEQQWIIGKTLAEDSDKLVDCGIRTSGSVIILYLLTAAHDKQLLSSEAVVGMLAFYMLSE